MASVVSAPPSIAARTVPAPRGRGWRLAVALLAALVGVPLAVIVASWGTIDAEIWSHLASTVMPRLLANTALLLAGVGVGTAVLGVGLAWLTVMCAFPGRRWFDWMLMLPLAVPAYVLAMIAIGLFDFSGPLQTALRAWLGPGQWLPPIRSTGGVVAVMTLALYPYVYMLARSAFLGQGRSQLEAARALGYRPREAFLRVAIPGARPAIAAGIGLALMEALADFGTVATFNFDTFTTAIYKTWFGFFKVEAAAQLASLLLLLVALGVFGERKLRGRARYVASGAPARDTPIRLRGARAWAASGVCALVFALGFGIPMAQLALWVVPNLARELDAQYWTRLGHTLVLGGGAALFTVAGALVLAYARRHWPSRGLRASVRIATLGYALPGSVLAVGIMIAFTWIDRGLATVLAGFGIELDAVLRGSVWALLLAYAVRFLAVAYGPVDSGFERIRPSLVEAARSLGAGQRQILTRVYLPLLRPGVLSAALLVLVDVMKEQPATLMLRPFGWDTFAVRIFELTSEGEWERAALPALTLVLTGLLPVLLLVRKSAGR